MKNRTSKNAAFAAALLLAGGILTAAAPSATAQDEGRHAGRYGQNDRNNRNNRRRGANNWNALEGRPAVRAGRESGFFIWRTGRTVHLLTTDTNDGRNVYKGEITVENGRFNDLRKIGNSGEDKATRNDPSRITFEFNTHRDTDELRFDVLDGDRLTFRLTRDGRDGDRVYIGSNKQSVSGDTITFNLR